MSMKSKESLKKDKLLSIFREMLKSKDVKDDKLVGDSSREDDEN